MNITKSLVDNCMMFVTCYPKDESLNYSRYVIVESVNGTSPLNVYVVGEFLYIYSKSVL